MATKTLTITQEAYDRLAALKKPQESFSRAIMRLTGKARLTEFAGILSAMDAQDIEASTERLRERDKERLHSLRGAVYHL